MRILRREPEVHNWLRPCMFRKTVLLLVSLVITVCLLLFTDLSVAYIDKTTPYSVAFEFDGELPQFKTHQLALGFSSGHDIQAYQKIYHFTQNGNTVRFSFNTRLEHLSTLKLYFKYPENVRTANLNLIKVEINGRLQKLEKSSVTQCCTDDAAVSAVLDQPFYPEQSSLEHFLDKMDLSSFVWSLFLLFLVVSIVMYFLVKTVTVRTVELHFKISDLAILLVLYIFNAVLVMFFARDFADAVSVNLTCLLVSALEFAGLYALIMLFARRRIMLAVCAGIWMLTLTSQLMCLVISLSYISIVSAGNINIDNISVLLNWDNGRFLVLFVLAFLLFISYQNRTDTVIVLKGLMAKFYLVSAGLFLAGSFFLNTIANGSSLENFQSPVMELVKTTIIRYFPDSAGFISPVTQTMLTEYPENNISNRKTFFNDSVYEEPIPYRQIKPLDRPNVIVFFVESFTAEFIDSYRTRPLNLMPFMSGLQKNWPDKNITLVRNYFNHSATTVKNIRSQLLSGFQYDSVVHKDTVDDSSLIEILGRFGYTTYFVSPEGADSEFQKMLETTGFDYPVYNSMTSIDNIKFTETDCGGGNCSDDLTISKLKDLISFHKSRSETSAKPYFIGLYNLGTHLNESGRMKFKGGDNRILNRNYTLDVDLESLIKFYYSELSEDTVMILTADHSIIPGDYGSQVIDFDQSYITNEIPFYIFQPYYELPKELDLHEVGGYASSLAMAPTVLHLLQLNPENYFLGCSMFEKQCRRAVDLSKYIWYSGLGIYLKDGDFENGKKFKPVAIDNKLQQEYPAEDFRLYNLYRKAYLKVFDQ